MEFKSFSEIYTFISIYIVYALFIYRIHTYLSSTIPKGGVEMRLIDIDEEYLVEELDDSKDELEEDVLLEADEIDSREAAFMRGNYSA